MIFQQLIDKSLVPTKLLQLADPSLKMIESYIEGSNVYVAKVNNEIRGIIVLSALSVSKSEIKNIAVVSKFQGNGIGSFLLENIIKTAIDEGVQEILIGTANSSIGQLYLYQKYKFEITGIIKDYYIQNYEFEIIENGIQAKHKIILTNSLLMKYLE